MQYLLIRGWCLVEWQSVLNQLGNNNELKRATPTIKLGLNSEIIIIYKGIGIKHNLGVSKVKLPYVAPNDHKIVPHFIDNKIQKIKEINC